MHLRALAALPLVLVAAACTHGPYAQGGGAASPTLVHMRRGGIAFAYPAAWRFRRRNFDTTMSEGLVDLSSQPMVNPCRTHARETVCSWPIRHLRRDGIVVRWDLYGGLLPHLPRVGVRLQRIHDPFCRRIGGAETLVGRVVTPGRRRLYDAYACLGPEGRAGNAAAFRAMVGSARPV